MYSRRKSYGDVSECRKIGKGAGKGVGSGVTVSSKRERHRLVRSVGKSVSRGEGGNEYERIKKWVREREEKVNDKK